MTPIVPAAAVDYSTELRLRERLIEAGIVTPSAPGPRYMSPQEVANYRTRLINSGHLKPAAAQSVRPKGMVLQ